MTNSDVAARHWVVEGYLQTVSFALERVPIGVQVCWVPVRHQTLDRHGMIRSVHHVSRELLEISSPKSRFELYDLLGEANQVGVTSRMLHLVILEGRTYLTMF